jgi:hypothetical protein
VVIARVRATDTVAGNDALHAAERAVLIPHAFGVRAANCSLRAAEDTGIDIASPAVRAANEVARQAGFGVRLTGGIEVHGVAAAGIAARLLPVVAAKSEVLVEAHLAVVTAIR